MTLGSAYYCSCFLRSRPFSMSSIQETDRRPRWSFFRSIHANAFLSGCRCLSIHIVCNLQNWRFVTFCQLLVGILGYQAGGRHITIYFLWFPLEKKPAISHFIRHRHKLYEMAPVIKHFSIITRFSFGKWKHFPFRLCSSLFDGTGAGTGDGNIPRIFSNFISWKCVKFLLWIFRTLMKNQTKNSTAKRRHQNLHGFR